MQKQTQIHLPASTKMNGSTKYQFIGFFSNWVRQLHTRWFKYEFSTEKFYNKVHEFYYNIILKLAHSYPFNRYDSSNAWDLHTSGQQKTTLIKILFEIQMETTNLLAVTASFLIAESSDLLEMSWKYNLFSSKDKTTQLKTAKQTVGWCTLTLFALLSDRPDKSSNKLLVCLGVTAADDGAAECIGAPAVGLLGPEGGEGKLADAKSANSPCCLKII